MKDYTTIQTDLQTIEDIFSDISFSELCKKVDLTETEYLAIKNNEVEPTKQQLETIYNFAYNKGLYLNEITWQEALDKYRRPGIDVVSHGARTYIKGDIQINANGLGTAERSAIAAYRGGETNDFSYGFYMGQDISQSGMFVCNEPNSSLYILTFDTHGLKKAQFNVSIDWMIAICWFRGRIDEYENSPRVQKIIKKVDECDYVLAPIADNKMWEVLDAFSAREITDLQCLYALSATHLGFQYVLKTQKCLDQLQIREHMYFCSVEKSLYTKESDVETNTSLNKAIIAKKRYANEGVYIDELLS